MAITASGPNNDNEYVISISGDFDFNQVKPFRQSYEEIPHAARTVVIDFRKTDYMDSSGLGMLIKLRKYFGKDADIRLRTANPQVMNILEIARFGEQFNIE
jgi:anti-anti-sigma factor